MTTSDVIAANCLGVDVPMSPFLNPKRIKRINEAGYEGQEIKAALHLVKEGDIVLELGAGIGVVSGVIAHNCKPKKIVSYEANPNLIPHIRELHKINKLTRVNSVRNKVLISDPNAPASLPFFVHKSYLGSTLMGEAINSADTVDIQVDMFNTVVKDLNPTVLVMDIEGGELDLLRHADISGFRSVVIEFHPKIYGVPAMRECKNYLRQAGLSPVADFSTRRVWAATRA